MVRGCRHLLTTFHCLLHGAGNVGPGDCPFYVYSTHKWCPSSSLARHNCFPYGREIRFASVGQQTYNIGLATSGALEWSAILLLVGKTQFLVLSK